LREEGLSKALWVLFACLFCWPFIGVADGEASVLGIPTLLFHVFLGWGVLVAILAAVGRGTEGSKRE
jgi:hypothetical protein